MNAWTKKCVAALTLGAATIVATAPADAQRWRGGGPGWNRGWGGGPGWNRGWRGGWRGAPGWRGGYGWRGYDRTGVAIGAGLLGLGMGAAIASANRPYYGGYGYYGGPAYYGDPYGGFGWGGCYTRREWDPYTGRRVHVQICD